MPRSRRTVGPLTRRPELEGLRGWLAAVIVLYHLTFVPVGGVIGVDVFFALSGYLITRLLLDEHDRTGLVDLGAFYVRRARRLLPVAGAVLGATVAASFAVWSTPRALDVLLDAVTSATFSANWHLIAAGTDYLQHDGPVSPLQHFWSLAVEEQFYVVWPLVVVLVLAAVRRRDATRRRLVVGCTALVASVASAAWSWHLTATSIEAAYFDPFGRAWEIGVGAACGALVPLVAVRTVAWRARATSLGMLLVLGSLLLTEPLAAFPWPGALPAVLGTALVLSFGSADLPGAPRLLCAPAAVWAGRRSYSIYLWHFPVAVVGSALVDSWWRVPASVALTFVLSAASYRWVERPALRGPGAARPTAAPGRPPGQGRVAAGARAPRAARPGLAVAAVVAVLVVVSSAAQVRSPTKLGEPSALASVLGLASEPPGGGDVPPLPARDPGTTVLAALEADTWSPAERSEIDSAFATSLAPAMDPHTGCRHDPTPSPDGARTCRWGPDDAERTAVVVGDSVAASWTSGIAAALVPEGWAVVALAFAGCTPVDLPPTARYDDPGFEDACSADREAMAALPAASGADLVVVSGGVNVLARRADAVGPEAAEREWRDAAESTLRRLAATTPRVVLLGAPPAGQAVRDCAVRVGSPGACVTTTTAAQRAQVAAEQAAATAAGPRVEHVDVTPWFCADGRCPAVLGGRLVRLDRSHLTEATSLATRDLLADRLLDATPPPPST
ncbi:acyltransferase [Frigoribacterium sp. CFBP 13729]|uniref:acyltransferase family protein n=1 Tax=unclassified Frigoribacterium TaxID=2627005 RepID=UPI00177F64D4|nr:MULTISPECIES: acyltransferase family protein [unclassified Frigoribacterium]MBD8585891.1 acyltransferase [Frigoribacterium sp. CFBP 8766]MBD8611323.1 acyltransferase [Frigoribacterium sp. CFBP 13729]